MAGNDPLASPSHQIRFEPVAPDEGMRASNVSWIYQDQLGFLWIATLEGLAKYDGYKVRVFKHEPFDHTSPSSNDIRKIIEDQQGNIWMIAGSAINRYDRELDRFFRYDVQPKSLEGLGSHPLDLYCDSRGLIWVGTVDKGIYLYNHEFDNFINYGHNPYDPSSLSSDRVTAIFESSDGSLWFGTDGGGLNRYNFDTATFTTYLDEAEDPEFGITFGIASIPRNLQHSPIFEDENGMLWVITLGGGLVKLNPNTGQSQSFVHSNQDPNSISDNLIYAMFRDSRGWFWLATADGGLDTFDPDTGTFRKFRHQALDPNSLGYQVQQPFSFAEDSWGNLWIGSRDGIHVYDPQMDGFRRYEHQPTEPWSLPSDHVNMLMFDQSKTLWVGLQAGGLAKYSAHKMKFPGFFASPANQEGLPIADISSVFEDGQGQLWLGTQGQGLLKFNPQLGQVIGQITGGEATSGLPAIVNVHDVVEDRHNRIWLGSDSGLFSYQKLSGQIRHFPIPRRENQTIYTLHTDGRSRLWVGTEGWDLFEFDLESENFHILQLTDRSEQNWTPKINDIIGDGNGGLWIAHSGVGLHHYLPQSGQLTSHTNAPENDCSLSHFDLISLLLDRDKNLWIGTGGGGLNMLPADNDCFQHFTQKKNGLPSNHIYGLLQDGDGKIWVSVYSGLAVFQERSRRFQAFDLGDGLVQPTRTPHAFFENTSGKFFLGGRNGLNIFAPESLNHNPHSPPIVITQFSKMGETVSRELTSGSTLNLDYEDDILVFEFSALDFTYPERNQYAYQLEGFREDWVKAGTKRDAIFTNLNPGKYTFRVKGSNSDGIWSQKPLTLQIHIAPPFWQTWWFYALEIAAALLLVWSAFLYQRRRLHVQQNEALVALDLKRKTQELEYARHLQLSMLPKSNVDHPNFEAFGQMRTATEVGGDYYDFFELNPTRYAITVGDATGHGFAAGLVVGMTKMSTTVWAMNQQASPQEMIEELNLGLKRSLSEKKMGMALGLLTLDLSEMQAEMAFSGMPFPYHYQARHGKLVPLVMKGPPLGYFERIFVQTTKVQLAPGDYLIFLSDGFGERFNPSNQLWGKAGLETCLEQVCRKGVSASLMADLVFKACDEFAEGRAHDDDMTAVIIRLKDLPES